MPVNNTRVELDPTQRRRTRISLAMVAVAAMAALVAGILDQTGMPTQLLEDLRDLLAVVLISSSAAYLIRGLVAAPALRRTMYLAAFLLVAHQVLLTTGTMDSLDRLPVLGGHGLLHPQVAGFSLVAGLAFFLTAFYLALREVALAGARYAQQNRQLTAEAAARRKIEQDALRAKEEWERTFDAIPDPILILDKNYTIIRINQAMAVHAGISPEQAIGLRCYSLVHGTKMPISQCPHQRLLEDGQEHVAELLDERSGRWFLVSTSPLWDAADRIAGSVHVMRDITQRKEAETELNVRLERIRREQAVVGALALSEAVTEGDVSALARELTELASEALEVERVNVWLFNEGETELVCVDNYERSLGRHTPGAVLREEEFRNEFDALKTSMYVDAHDALTDPRTAGYVEGYLKPNRITSMLDAVIRAYGRNLGTVCLEHVNRPHRWAPDEVAFACQLADQVAMTVLNQERSRRAAALRESEERFRNLMEHLPNVAIQGYRPDGMVMYWNPASENLYGYAAEEAIGRNLGDLIVPPDLKAAFRECCAIGAKTTKSGEFWPAGELTLQRKDGSPVSVYSTHIAVCVEGQAPVLFCIDVDLTERKRAEEERLEMERRVLYTQKLESLGVLAGGIAHDFNNLLVGILGNAELARERLPEGSPERARIRDIVTAGQRAADLCRQMLAYSGRGRFVIETLDLRQVIQEMADMLAVSISKKAILRYDFAWELPHIRADAAQIRQVVMNLIINASEAITDSGEILASVFPMTCDRAYLRNMYLGEDLPEGRYVCLEVADTGCGMDAATVARIFEPFFSTKFAGRGLGMAAVLGIVRGHRGAIKLESEPGKGTTVRILFPAVIEVAKMGREAEGRTEGAPTTGGLVLLVDDEEVVRKAAHGMLERLGFSVLTATNGREALDIYRQHQDEVRCVLLDLTMPEMDGEEALHELRRLNPNVRVLLCSGYDEEDLARRFDGTCAPGFLHKPYSLAELREKIRVVLPE